MLAVTDDFSVARFMTKSADNREGYSKNTRRTSDG